MRGGRGNLKKNNLNTFFSVVDAKGLLLVLLCAESLLPIPYRFLDRGGIVGIKINKGKHLIFV